MSGCCLTALCGKDVEEFYVKLILNSLKVKRAEWANLMSLSSQKIWANLKTSNNHTNKFLSILKKGLPNSFPFMLFFSSMIYVSMHVVFQCFISTHYQVLFVLVSTSQQDVKNVHDFFKQQQCILYIQLYNTKFTHPQKEYKVTLCQT